MKIELGMLVQVVDKGGVPEEKRYYVGLVGTVLRQATPLDVMRFYALNDGKYWILDVDPSQIFHESHLRPINPPDWEKLSTPNEIPEGV